jgi:hypothetical protein
MSSRNKVPADTAPGLQPGPRTKCFFLFGYIKRKLTEYDIPGRESLKSSTTYIFDETEQETIIIVFETWINRLEWVIEHEGEYFHEERRMKENSVKKSEI